MAQIVIHAHCYQPPREEPWLDLVPREASAAPDHDWNSRITRECYRPLSRARVLDADNRIRRVFNAWEWLSFDVGPTLVHWLERHAPDVVAAMQAGDSAARARTGFGTAMAHPYHHVILPLASRRDKRTEVRWGIREFQRIFGRDPLTMWLPETAVDEETLDIIATEGIQGVVVAPHQLAHPAPDGRPQLWRQGNQSVWLMAYDGALAHGVAFGDLLDDGNRLSDRLTASPRPVVALATDGETFGHHHAFGDLAIAAVIDRLHGATDHALVGVDAVIGNAAQQPSPTGEAELVSPTSWSCPHGVERWRSNCGCRMDPHTSQEWRGPLRLGLELLARGIDAVVEREWPVAAGNRHELRDRAGPDQQSAGPIPAPARLLLEAERHALAMFTSCAWFFDDIARIEPRVVLRHAARALELLPADDAEALEAGLVTALAGAAANDPRDGTGATIWTDLILPGRRAPAALVAALAAIHDLAPDHVITSVMPSHEWQITPDCIVLRHRSSGLERRWHAAPVSLGVLASRVHVRELGGRGWSGMIEATEFPAPLRTELYHLAAPLVFDRGLAEPMPPYPLPDGDDRYAPLRRALSAAWRNDENLDGADLAVRIHAALDLWALSASPLPDDVRSEARLRLAQFPPSLRRDQLAERFGVVLETE